MQLLPDLSLLAILVAFLLNYWIVRTFFFKPINRILTEREEEIGSSQRRYEESLARFNAAVSEIEANLHQARRDGATVREARRSEAVTHRASLIERTRHEAERIVTEATSRLNQDVAAARERIVRESESLARMAAERIVGRKIA